MRNHTNLEIIALATCFWSCAPQPRPVEPRSGSAGKTRQTPQDSQTAREVRPQGKATIQSVAGQICRSKDLKIEQLFSADFREGGTVKRLVRRLTKQRSDFGPCLRVEHRGKEQVRYVHEKAIIVGRVYLNSQGLVDGIWFDHEIPRKDSLKKILAEMRELPGKVALTVRREGQPNLASLRSNEPLAVASAFKLFVFKALIEEIRKGKMKWQDVIRLKKVHQVRRSFPFGRFAAGHAVTLETLAAFMMMTSDNSATDHLIHYLGRSNVEQYAGPRNRPLPTTLEMYKLKSPKLRSFATQYIKARESGRRAVLKKLSGISADQIESTRKPTLVDQIEWFYTTNELCEVILSLKTSPLLGFNKGLARKDPAWDKVAHKSGYEPGARNFTFALRHRSSQRWYCLSASWNNPKARLKNSLFRTLVRRVMFVLSEKEAGK
ncbi:serine hydrolase [Myxococcota bacterium]